MVLDRADAVAAGGDLGDEFFDQRGLATVLRTADKK
jgi:hypothetical protein